MLQASPIKEAIPLVCPGCGFAADDESAMVAHWIRSRAYREKGDHLEFQPGRDHTDPLDTEPEDSRQEASGRAKLGSIVEPGARVDLSPPAPTTKKGKGIVYEMPIADLPWWRRYFWNWRYALLMFNLGAISFTSTLMMLYTMPRIYLWYGAPWPLTVLIPWGNMAAWMLGHLDIALVVSIITLVSLKVGVARTVLGRAVRLSLLAFWFVVGVGFVALCWVSFVLLVVWLAPKIF